MRKNKDSLSAEELRGIACRGGIGDLGSSLRWRRKGKKRGKRV
jgi:hypothetical protein